jgi:hypothetical protein
MLGVMNPAIFFAKNVIFINHSKCCNLRKPTHFLAYFLCLTSNEPIQFKNCALCFFGLKKIACEWVGNHDFDHFWSKKSQNFLNFMEHIYAR